MAQYGPKMAKIASICPKMAQYGPKIALRWFPRGPKNPAVAPGFVIKLVTFARRPSNGPRWPQDGPRCPKLPKMATKWPKKAKDKPKVVPR